MSIIFTNKIKMAGAVIFLLALLVRTVYTLSLSPIIDESQEPDARVYLDLGKNLVQTGTFGRTPGQPDAEDPPLLPFVLAGIYRLGLSDQHSILLFRLMQVLLGALVCLMVFWLGSRTHSLGLGVTAGILTALHPGLIVYGTLHLTESLYTFLLIILVCLIYQALLAKQTRAAVWYALGAGIVLGLCTLAREAISLFILFLIPWLLLMRFPWRTVFKFWSLLAVGLVICISPWYARNYIQFKNMNYPNSQKWLVLYVSNYIPPGEHWNWDKYNGAMFMRLVEQPDYKDENYRPAAINEFKKYLFGKQLLYLDMTMRKQRVLWFWPNGLGKLPTVIAQIRDRELGPGGGGWGQFIRQSWQQLGWRFPLVGWYVMLHLLMLPLAGGIIVWDIFKRDPRFYLFTGLIIYIILLHGVLLFPSIRYHLPVVPYINLLAAAGVITRLKQIHRGGKLHAQA